MGTTLEGKIIRGVGRLLIDPSKTAFKHFSFVHVAPTEDEDRTLIEVMNGQAWLRIEQPEACDEPVLIDRNTTRRALNEDTFTLEGNWIIRPYQVACERPDGSTPEAVTYPDTEAFRPDSAQRVAFTFDPKGMADLCNAMAAAGVTDCQLLLPRVRGGPIGFRGDRRNDDRVSVEAAFLPRDMFTAAQGDEPQDAESATADGTLHLPFEDDQPALPSPT